LILSPESLQREKPKSGVAHSVSTQYVSMQYVAVQFVVLVQLTGVAIVSIAREIYFLAARWTRFVLLCSLKKQRMLRIQ
jgi:hypothetical protein